MKSGSEKESEERREGLMKGGRSYKGNEGDVKGRGRDDGWRDGLSVLGRGREERREEVRKRWVDGRGSMLIIRTIITTIPRTKTIQYDDTTAAIR